MEVSLLTSIAEAKEELVRERATHIEVLAAKEMAATKGILDLVERHKLIEESFMTQRDALNGHISGTAIHPSFISTIEQYRSDRMIDLIPLPHTSHMDPSHLPLFFLLPALKESGLGERDALVSLLSSLKEAANKEKVSMRMIDDCVHASI